MTNGHVLIWPCTALSAAMCVVSLAADQPPQPPRSTDVEVRTSLDRTAMWVGDRVSYTIQVTCKRGVDVLDDDFSREKLKLDGLDLVDSSSAQETGLNDSTTHRFRYVVTTYRVDAPLFRIGSLTARYYVKRPGQPLQDTAPAGEIEVPGAVIALRSMLPDERETAELRDGHPPSARPPLFAAAQPIGLGLIVASIVPAAAWGAALFGSARRRTVRRSARQVRHEERDSLEAVRVLDLDTPDGRRAAYSKLDVLVRSHLRDVCGIPGPSLTPSEVVPALAARGSHVPSQMVASLLTACERARFAPPGFLPSAEACREALEQAETLLKTR